MQGLLSPRELAAQTGWPERRIRQMIADNELRHLRLKNRIFVPVNALDEFVERNMVEPDVGGQVGGGRD